MQSLSLIQSKLKDSHPYLNERHPHKSTLYVRLGVVWKSETVHRDDHRSAEANVVLKGNLGAFNLPLASQASQLPAQLGALSQTYDSLGSLHRTLNG